MWGPGGIFAESQGGVDDFEAYRKEREALKKAKAKSGGGASGCNKNSSGAKNASGGKTIDLAGGDSSNDDSF